MKTVKKHPGTTKHEETSWYAFESSFKFFDKKLELHLNPSVGQEAEETADQPRKSKHDETETSAETEHEAQLHPSNGGGAEAEHEAQLQPSNGGGAEAEHEAQLQ